MYRDADLDVLKKERERIEWEIMGMHLRKAIQKEHEEEKQAQEDPISVYIKERFPQRET